ncbi:MAG: Obg family GTPase CgtA [Candidatus Omnitrophota bacterium]
MLIDHAKIYVSAGDGGEGCQSLFKDIFHRRGIPDGGDGGNGGNIVFKADTNLNTLLDFKYNQHYCAENGGRGGSNRKFGRSGKDKTIKVPVGTIIKDADNDLIIRDFTHPEEAVIAAKGGCGGKGSAKVREVLPSGKGESKTIILELKLVADAGIIGFPNAGKSTLVSRISNSRSKIAAYPFTTRSPKLGVVRAHKGTFVVADMPGIIEGAHSGRGLGDRFLRHIERTSVLVHLVEISPLDGSDPFENYSKLEKELELYSREVFNKPRIIAVSKMDTPASDSNLEIFRSKIKEKIWPVSALRGDGLADIISEIYRKVQYEKEKTQENNS